MQKNDSVKTRLNEYFARKSAIKGNLIVAAILAIASIIFSRISDDTLAGTTMMLIKIAFLWLTASCFFRHNVNGMQCTIGAFLGSQIFHYIYGVSRAGWAACLPLAFAFVLFITHQYLISQRQSKGNALYLNQLLGALFMLACVVDGVAALVLHGFEIECLTRILLDIFTAAAMNMIITIETRINEYKIRRDALTSDGKWNDGAKEKLKKEIFG